MAIEADVFVYVAIVLSWPSGPRSAPSERTTAPDRLSSRQSPPAPAPDTRHQWSILTGVSFASAAFCRASGPLCHTQTDTHFLTNTD